LLQNLKISQLTQIYYQSRTIKSRGDVWTCGLNGGKQQINAKFFLEISSKAVT